MLSTLAIQILACWSPSGTVQCMYNKCHKHHFQKKHPVGLDGDQHVTLEMSACDLTAAVHLYQLIVTVKYWATSFYLNQTVFSIFLDMYCYPINTCSSTWRFNLWPSEMLPFGLPGKYWILSWWTSRLHKFASIL